MLRLLEGKTIAVTGADGFIGSFVVPALLRQGSSVRALIGSPEQTPRPALAGVPSWVGDITDAAVLYDLVGGADIVVHLAGTASVKESFAKASECARVHVCGTATVLEACRGRGVKRFVYLSSAEVYGRPMHEVVREDHRLEARSPYGAAKIGAEKVIEAFAHSDGIRAAILRAFSIYGPGSSSESIFGTILRQARSNDRLELRDLRPVRDYCYVEDLVDAVVLSCATRFEGNCPMNIGTGRGTSVGELAKLVLEYLGQDLPIVEGDKKERPSGSEIYRLVADCSLARRVLGWSPGTPIRVGIENTLRALSP